MNQKSNKFSEHFFSYKNFIGFSISVLCLYLVYQSFSWTEFIKELAKLVNRLTNNPRGIEFEPEGQTFVRNRIAAVESAARDLHFEAKIELEAGLRELISWRLAHKGEVEERRNAAGVP